MPRTSRPQISVGAEVGDAFGVFDFRLSEADEERARKLHADSVIVDLLCQGPCGYRSFDRSMEDEIQRYLANGASLAEAFTFVRELPMRRALEPGGDWILEECWRASGVTAGARDHSFTSLRAMFARLSIAAAQFDRFPWFVRATHPDHIRAAKRGAQVAGFVNSQYTVGLGTDLELLERAHYLGLVMLQLTYNAADYVGSGCLERGDGGLTHFGVRLVKRANELGIILDTSHCGPSTTLDACTISSRPVVASHTSAATLYGHERAKSDELLQAIAATGGVIGVYALPYFLTPEPEPSIEHMLDHIDYIAGLVGWEHVAIGTDWPLQMPKSALSNVFQPWSEKHGFGRTRPIDATRNLLGFDDYRDFPNITRGLVARGYADEQIRAILGENFLRVFEAVVT